MRPASFLLRRREYVGSAPRAPYAAAARFFRFAFHSLDCAGSNQSSFAFSSMILGRPWRNPWPGFLDIAWSVRAKDFSQSFGFFLSRQTAAADTILVLRLSRPLPKRLFHPLFR